MPGSIGQVYYDVLPDLDQFASRVAAGLGQQKPVKIRVDADTRAASANIGKLTGQTGGLDAVSRRLASAEGALRVSSARLAETRNKAAAGSARLIAAEEGHARALRTLGAAQEAVAASAAVHESRASRLLGALNTPQVQSFGRALTLAGAAIGVAVGAAVVTTAKFDTAVSHVAATGEDARGSLSRLRQEALRYGADTSFSAIEAAQAQEQLIKANVSVTDTIEGGLKGALDLAAAGSLDVASAAGIMATSMSQFGLKGDQASHVADLLAAGAGKAQGEVTDLAGALKYVGPVAHGMGVSIEEVVGSLALFADQGILGEQAGTALRGILVSLTSPSAKAAAEMKRLGIEVYDAQGRFVGVEGVAGQLSDTLGNLDEKSRDAALGTIFSNTQITAARVLFSGGAADVRKWTTAVSDSGFAQEVARTKMDNLRGDVEKLGGAFQTAFIETASSSTGPLRTLTQTLTAAVEAYSQLSDEQKSGIGFGAAIAASALIGVGGVIKLGGALSDAKGALDTLKISGRTAGLALGAVGIGITAAAAVIGHFAVESAEARARTDDLTQSLIASKGAIDATIASTRARALEESGALRAAQQLGLGITDVTQASLGNVAAQQRVNAAYGEYQSRLSAVRNTRLSPELQKEGQAWNAVRDAIGGGSEELNNARAAYERQKTAIDAAGGSTTELTTASRDSLGAILGVATAIDDVASSSRLGTDGVKGLTDALYGSADAAISASDAEIAYKRAIDAAAEAGKRNNAGINTNTKAGRANLELLNRQAQASQGHVSSLATQGASVGKLTRATQKARDSFIENARAMGVGKEEAKALADEYGLIPKDVKTKYALQIEAQQQAKLAALMSAIEKLPPEQQTKIRALIESGDFAGAEKLLAKLAKEETKKITPKVDPVSARLEKGKLDFFGNPIKKPVKVKTEGVLGAKKDIGGIKGKDAPVKVKSQGVPNTKRDIAGVKGKTAPVTVRSQGVPSTKRDIAGVKGKGVGVLVTPKGVPTTKSAINSVKGKTVPVTARAQGISAVQAAINSIRGKTVSIIQKLVPGNAGGGPVPGRAGGGRIPGSGGATADDVSGIDRATGRLAVMVSSREFITNAAQYAANRAAVETINAGGKWDLVPRGSLGRVAGVQAAAGGGRYAQQTTAAHRPMSVTVVIDLGPELGGIRRIVADAIEDRGELVATVGRMR